MGTSKLSLKFRIFKGNELIGFKELAHSAIKIGKVPSAHLCLDDESVSRMHAIVEVADTAAHIIDLGSTRGTFVNGQRVNKARLASGDVIEVGAVRLEVELAEGSAPARAPEPPELPAAALRAVPNPPVVAPVMTSAMPAPAPLAASPARPVPPAPFTTSALGGALADDEPGARAIEVAAMLGDSVVDVKHCMDPRGGQVTRATWGLLAGGVACLLASATAFYVSVDTAAANRAALEKHVAAKKPAYSFRPATVGGGVDGLAFGGLALGLLGMTAGLARARRERQSPYYRIGTAPGVQQPVEQAPAADFPLVAPAGDDFVFNYGAGMDGELIVDGQATPLAELAATGRARPSATTAGAIEVPIPARAKIRARAGQTTFLVSAVAKPRAQTAPLLAGLERRTAAYVAGSLALHVGIVAFLQTIPPEAGGFSLDLDSKEITGITARNNVHDDVPPPPEDGAADDDAAGDPAAGATMALAEGAGGRPDAAKPGGHIRIKDRQTTPQLAREEAIRAAQEAGVLGSVAVLDRGISSITGTASFSSGFDGSDVYGAYGEEGEGRGTGFGRSGTSFGGGCMYQECGLVGTGRYGTIGVGNRAGDGWGGGGSGGWGRKRNPGAPTATIGMPTPTDGLDKAIIRRYVKRNLAKISYCYEHELLAKPSLAGTVMVQFMITANGTVSMANGQGVDPTVASCVASVVKGIAFPKPSNGGSVQVNYPFTFRAAGR